MPDSADPDEVLERVGELENLVARTDLSDIRLQRFSGEILRTPPTNIEVRLEASEPRFSREDGAILALFTHRLEYLDSDNDGQIVGHIEATHLVEVTLSAGSDPSDEAISALVAGNLLFMVFPYVRSSLHRLPSEFGLPPVLLPYLRRATLGVVLPGSSDEASADEDAEGSSPIQAP